MRRVALIGLDGAAPRFVFDQWRDELPTLRALAAGGVWGPLRSGHPPITVPAWVSMLSGKDAGQLGCYGFRNRRSRAYDEHVLATSRSVRHDRVWDVLSRTGVRVIVLGVPPTYPPHPVNGCMVSCFLTPSIDNAYTYPPGLQPDVERAAGGYVFDVDQFRTADKPALLRRVYEKTRKHFAVARHLLATQAWDFFAMVEMGVDRMHHGFWRYADPGHPQYVPGHPLEHSIRDYYRYLDAELSALLELIGSDATVLVVSDHGARALEGGFCFNEWLVRRGDLRLAATPAGPTPLRPALVDWPRTRAWGEGGYYGRLFLNVRGREPAGTIDRRDYERVRTDLIDAIADIEAPDGTCLGSRAYRPEELYVETTGIPPDLLVYFGDLRWRSVGAVGVAQLHTAENDSGPDDANHDWDGIFIMREGREDRGGQRLDGLQLMDVAPTILRQFGLPTPAGMQGRAIEHAGARGVS